LEEWIRRQIAAQPNSFLRQLAIALACVAVGTILRWVIAFWIPTGIAFVTFFPFLLVAVALGGARAGVVTLFGAVIAGSFFMVEAQHQWPPRTGWIGAIAFLLSGGMIVWLTHLATQTLRGLDIAHNQERLLVEELQHRVKNTLAIVQAIAQQTFHTAGDGAGFRGPFTDRLVALGRAHSVLSDASWREVTLRILVLRAIEPFVAEGSGRIVLDGPDLRLGPQLVVDLALCLHELAVNATKHGALSNSHGRVEVRWRALPANRIELTWTEADGPSVAKPTRRGFGSRLLEQGLSGRAHPTVVTEYRPEGLRWTAQFDTA
jgi:two-component sensor histidine kinase